MVGSTHDYGTPQEPHELKDERMLGWVGLMDENLMKRNIALEYEKDKRKVCWRRFCFLEVVSSFVYLLQGYVGWGSDGAKLGSFNVSQTLNNKLFFCDWWSFGDGGSSTRIMASEFNEGVAIERIKMGTAQKLNI